MVHLLFVLLCIVVMLSVFSLLELLNIPNYYYSPDPDEIESGHVETFIINVIFVPFFETLLHQLLPYWLLSKIRYFRKHKIWIILISALIFGVGHYFSLHYIIFGFVMGVIFMFIYILRIGKYPFWTLFAVHALMNFSVFLVKTLAQ